MSLEGELGQWDRKSTDFIAGLFDRHNRQPGFLTGLVGMLDDPALQSGASWLLKRHFDQGGEPLEDRLVSAVYSMTPKLVHWDAKLHVLQCIKQMPVPDTEMRAVEAFVRHCLADDAKFVRAWAYSGFCELARRFPQFQVEATHILNEALSSETAGSVLSRVRRELQRGFAAD